MKNTLCGLCHKDITIKLHKKQTDKKNSHGDANLKNLHYSLHTQNNLEDKKEYVIEQKKITRTGWKPKRITGNKIYLHTSNCMCVHSDCKCRDTPDLASCSWVRWQLPQGCTCSTEASSPTVCPPPPNRLPSSVPSHSAFIARVTCAIWVTGRMNFHPTLYLCLLTTSHFAVVERREVLFSSFFIHSFQLLRELHIHFLFVCIYICALSSAGIFISAKRKKKIKYMDLWASCSYWSAAYYGSTTSRPTAVEVAKHDE